MLLFAQMDVADNRFITEEDFAQYFNPAAGKKAWKQNVNLLMITDGQDDEDHTPPPSPVKEKINPVLAVIWALWRHKIGADQDMIPDGEVFPDQKNRTFVDLVQTRAAVEKSADLGVAAINQIRSPLLDMDFDQESRIVEVIAKLCFSSICMGPMRPSDFNLLKEVTFQKLTKTRRRP